MKPEKKWIPTELEYQEQFITNKFTGHCNHQATAISSKNSYNYRLENSNNNNINSNNKNISIRKES